MAKRNSACPPVSGTQGPEKSEGGLSRIRAAAKRDPHLQFNNLFHHFSPELLQRAYRELNRNAAAGVDEETWKDYGKNLRERIKDLHQRIHKQRYSPQPSLRVWVPKSDGRQRPIGISALEDKIVQQGLVWILESIYEEDFLGFSYGFRPGRSQHQALDALYVAITQRKVSFILDADIRGFFDTLRQAWMLKFMEHRISDKRILRLVEKTLSAGVIEEGKWSKTVVGTPQGSVASPIYSNSYLHYVLDLWVNQWRGREARCEVYIIRYADDFVVGFQYLEDGEHFYHQLKERLSKFGLTLHEDKTRLIEFGRFAAQNRKVRGEGKPETFDFLGFTHICDLRIKDGKFKLTRITISKRMRKKLEALKLEVKRKRQENAHEQGKWLRSVLIGLYNYYGVPGNRDSLDAFRTEICRMWFKSLRRRSHKAASMN
ncbi:group II intron reverse transcriptase/maturase [Deltaproteobacteria bacterium TL4]